MPAAGHHVRETARKIRQMAVDLTDDIRKVEASLKEFRERSAEYRKLLHDLRAEYAEHRKDEAAVAAGLSKLKTTRKNWNAASRELRRRAYEEWNLSDQYAQWKRQTRESGSKVYEVNIPYIVGATNLTTDKIQAFLRDHPNAHCKGESGEGSNASITIGSTVEHDTVLAKMFLQD